MQDNHMEQLVKLLSKNCVDLVPSCLCSVVRLLFDVIATETKLV